MEIAPLNMTYPGQKDPTNRPYPANQVQVYITLLHQRGPPHLINPRRRLPYDTREAPANFPTWGLPYDTSQTPAI